MAPPHRQRRRTGLGWICWLDGFGNGQLNPKASALASRCARERTGGGTGIQCSGLVELRSRSGFRECNGYGRRATDAIGACSKNRTGGGDRSKYRPAPRKPHFCASACITAAYVEVREGWRDSCITSVCMCKSEKISMRADSHVGRIILHLACQMRDHAWPWHWAGIRRELAV